MLFTPMCLCQQAVL